MRGTAPEVPVLEGDGSAGIGIWMEMPAPQSAIVFRDAYLNEMGITILSFQMKIRPRPFRRIRLGL